MRTRWAGAGWWSALLMLVIASSRTTGHAHDDESRQKRFDVPADVVEVERATLSACTPPLDRQPPVMNQRRRGGGDGGAAHTPPLLQVGTMTVSLPVTWANIGSISLLLVLALIGGVAVWRTLTRRSCKCKLCTGVYVVRDALGKGGFGRLYTTHRRGAPDTLLVLKMVQLDSVTELDSAQLEAKELRALHHPFIVRHVDDFVHNVWGATGESLHVCIAMEWCAQDLRHIIADRDVEEDGPLPEARVLKWLAQLVSALAYCHRKNVSHRDVKSQNVFVSAHDDIRLGDFGLCKTAPGMMTFSEGGTDTYMPPEVMLGQKLDSKKVDVWCLGLVLYELLSLKFVCEHSGLLGALAIKSATAVPELLENIPAVTADGEDGSFGGGGGGGAPRFAGYSSEIRKVALRMLAVDPAERPSMETLLKKKLLAKYTSKKGGGGSGGGGGGGVGGGGAHHKHKGGGGGGREKSKAPLKNPQAMPRSFMKRVSSAEDLRRENRQQQQQRRRQKQQKQKVH